jgi:hypothetical protein
VTVGEVKHDDASEAVLARLAEVCMSLHFTPPHHYIRDYCHYILDKLYSGSFFRVTGLITYSLDISGCFIPLRTSYQSYLCLRLCLDLNTSLRHFPHLQQPPSYDHCSLPQPPLQKNFPSEAAFSPIFRPECDSCRGYPGVSYPGAEAGGGLSQLRSLDFGYF